MPTYLRGFDPMDKSAEFAALGTAFRRGNYDGTAATPQRLLTSNAPVNLNVGREGITILDGNKRALLLVKRDSVKEVKQVDFSGAVDITRVTPDEIIAALNAAGFTNMMAVIDLPSGACNFTCTDPNVQYTEVFGYLAGALGFGGTKAFQGFGSFFRDYTIDDDTITCTRADQKTENTSVDQQGGGHNTLTRVTQQGRRTGVQYTVNLKPKDNVLRQIFEGGELIIHPSYDPKPDHYIPPDRTGPNGMIEMYRLAPLYPANRESKEGQDEGVIVEHVFAGMGTVQDPSTGAMSLSSFNYLIDAGIYINQNGEQIQQPEELIYSKNKWNLNRLIETLSNPVKMSDLSATMLTGVNLTTSINIAQSRIGYNQCSLVPPEADGFTVSFSPLATLTDSAIAWDNENARIIITTGTITGSEMVTVTFTNRDGTTVVKTFTLAVVA